MPYNEERVKKPEEGNVSFIQSDMGSVIRKWPVAAFSIDRHMCMYNACTTRLAVFVKYLGTADKCRYLY